MFFSRTTHTKAPLSFLFLFIGLFFVQAQLPMAWDAGVFGNKFEELVDAKEYFDGGFIMGGITYSDMGGDITEMPRGGGDFLVVRTDDQGAIQWSHQYGGTAMDRLTSLAITAGNDIICVGRSLSGAESEKSTPSFGNSDFWVIKLNDKGDLLWEKSFGGSEDDIPYSVAVHPSGDIYVLGFSNSPPSGNKTAAHYGSNDYWLVKLDANGNKIWDKSYGESGDERLYYGALTVAQDGNLMLGGSSDSGAGAMKSSANFGGMDYWVLKVDQSGAVIWEKSFGGVEEDQVQDIITTIDGGFLVAGGTRSPSGGNKSSAFYGLIDFWLVKLDGSGNMLWEKTYGGTGLEVITGIAENSVGNIMIGGLSDSPADGTKTKPNLGQFDYWLIFLDKNGAENWQDVYGGSEKDVLTVLIHTSDGGYFVGGDSATDVEGVKTTSNYGFNDYWFFKLMCGWDYSPDYDFTGCENQPMTIDLSTPDCPGCSFVWPDGTQSDQHEYDSTMPFGNSFEVIVSSAEGCPIPKMVAANFFEAPQFVLGNDTTVYENTQLVLRPNPTWVEGSFYWSTGDTVLATVVSSSGTYGLTIDHGGCTTYREITVLFDGTRSVYVPTAFSPNGDGNNDVFLAFGDIAVQNISQFMVFDRWGNQVFANKDFPPNVFSEGWDGTWRGQSAKEGVYIYLLEVEFTDGTTEMVKGDITLVR